MKVTWTTDGDRQTATVVRQCGRHTHCIDLAVADYGGGALEASLETTGPVSAKVCTAGVTPAGGREWCERTLPLFVAVLRSTP